MTPKKIARYYEAGTLGSFSTTLMDLIGKADYNHKLKIKIIFPEYVEAYDLYISNNLKG